MPSGVRESGNIPQRTQADKESKRARGALSCAECRRLKLKCSRTTWPCESCVRRGCSAICPNGSLVTGQGTRFVLADTDKLHAKIARMSDRIRHLEDALMLLQTTQSQEVHPLLASRELLMIKSSLDLHSAAEGALDLDALSNQESEEGLDSFGTLAIHDDGASTFYGRSAGSESLLISESSNETYQSSYPTTSGNIPAAIIQLSNAFPFSARVSHSPVDLDFLLQHTLPPFAEAKRLCALYYSQAQFYFGPVSKRQIDEEILPSLYSEARAPNASINRPSAHDLSLLFVIFCFGCLMDTELPFAPDNQEAERYSILTKAALNLDPIISRAPTVSTVQALCLMAIYEGLSGGDNSIESTWALFGLSTKLAQSVGLHRDPARWKLNTSEVQKRRSFFWELFATDCWQSLATGRLPTFSLPFVDTELPFDHESTLADDDSIQPSFVAWKARFGRDVLSAVVQGTLTSRAPKYSTILELDRAIRNFPIPRYAQGQPPRGKDLAGTMSYFMVHNYIELTSVYIHRVYFAQSISTNPSDPIQSPYAPSFLAGYRSACNLLGSIMTQFDLFPTQVARLWVLWTHGFSAAVMLSSVVTHATTSKVACAALLELRKAHALFEKASAYGGRSVKFLPILQRLLEKANRVFTSSDSETGREENDEFSVFSGKTTLKTVQRAQMERTSISPASSDSGSSHTNPAFSDAHPSLVHELRGFEHHITAQIERAHVPYLPSSHDHNQYAATNPSRNTVPSPSTPYGYGSHQGNVLPQGRQQSYYTPQDTIPHSDPSMYAQASYGEESSHLYHYQPRSSYHAWTETRSEMPYGHQHPVAEDGRLQETWQEYMTKNFVLPSPVVPRG